jgi:hypothetical protein
MVTLNQCLVSTWVCRIATNIGLAIPVAPIIVFIYFHIIIFIFILQPGYMVVMEHGFPQFLQANAWGLTA